jgi:hypothetical protein
MTMIENQGEFEETFKGLQQCAQALGTAMTTIDIMSQDVVRLTAAQKISVTAGKTYLAVLIQGAQDLSKSITNLQTIQDITADIARLHNRFLLACGEDLNVRARLIYGNVPNERAMALISAPGSVCPETVLTTAYEVREAIRRNLNAHNYGVYAFIKGEDHLTRVMNVRGNKHGGIKSVYLSGDWVTIDKIEKIVVQG